MRKQKDLSREVSTSQNTGGDTAGSAPCPEKEKQNFDILRVWTFCYHFPLALCYNTPPPVNFFFQWPFTIYITHLLCVEVLEKQAKKFNYHQILMMRLRTR